MAFDDFFRLGAHGVFLNEEGKVLMVKATYAERKWMLPGGAIDPNETIENALIRECQEELNHRVKVHYLSGIYYHSKANSHGSVFRCSFLEPDLPIILSEEHDEYRYFAIEDIPSPIQQKRILDCLHFTGKVRMEVLG